MIDVIDYPDADPKARPAATLVLLRDGEAGVETLMVLRSTKTSFAGMWAFPGGAIEHDDIPAGTAPDPIPAARRAAIRETYEEVGLEIDEGTLVFISHWLPPFSVPRRYSTWFFAAAAIVGEGDPSVDGHEVNECRWITPRDAMHQRDSGEITMAAPTFVTLSRISEFENAASALSVLTAGDPEYFAIEMTETTSGVGVCLFEGDASYRSGIGDESGALRRLTMHTDSGWKFVDNRSEQAVTSAI